MSELIEFGPDPDNPGWNLFRVRDETLFNPTVLGTLITRREGDICRMRLVPQRHHLNVLGIVHGGIVLALADNAAFASLRVLGTAYEGPAVTLELSTQFVGQGQPGVPLDALTEIVRETGRLTFVRGTIEQQQERIAAFSGILRKLSPR